MKLRRNKKNATPEHVTTSFDAHGLTVVVCLCGWERSLSSPSRALTLAEEHVAQHAH